MKASIDLSGKNALVTGSTSGIGLRFVELLIQSGCNLVYFHSSGKPESNKRAVDERNRLNSIYNGNHAEGPFFADIANPDEVEAMFKQIAGCGRLDILINNAGINIDKLALRMKPEDFSKVINTNICGTFYCCQEASKIIRKQDPRGGNIINMSSAVGTEITNIGQSNYAVSKAGIKTLTKQLALEYAPYNILVNAICPGFVDVGMTTRMSKNIDKETIKQEIPLKRFATPDDVFQAMIPLLDNESYITGQSIVTDGGISLIR